MKRSSTLFARLIVYLMGLAVLAVCLVLLPEIIREEAVAHPDTDRLTWPFVAGAYALTVPVFVALHQVLRLLGYIDRDQAFTAPSVRALRNIKYCALAFSALVVLGGLAVVTWARLADPTEEVTHIFTLSFIFTFASLVIAAVAALFQRLLAEALALKSENDLTV